MRVLALVPARGGSKRLPGKNVRPLCGKPLIQWSIESARRIAEVCEVLVSTDDEAIAGVALAAGARVPWLRPAELSSDTATTLDVSLHALDWFEREEGAVDGLLLLQPTSPFRSAEAMRRGLAAFVADPLRAVVGFSPAPVHPAWCFRPLADGGVEPFLGPEFLGKRSQDLPPAYAVNGAFYLISPAGLRQGRSFFPSVLQSLLMEHDAEAVDIDTEADWRVAETWAALWSANGGG